jgi:tripartite-type tricarboxylate transporter receptor subunit TctC
MRTTRFCLFGSVLLAPPAMTACAEDYPERPIRIVTSGACGGNDLIACDIAKAIARLSEINR